MSSGCKRRGTSSACDKASRTLLGSRPTSTFEMEDTSFAQSRDPRNVSHGIAHAAISLSRSGKLTQVRETGTGGESVWTSQNAWLTASRRLAREGREASEKEDGLGHRPCEESRAPCSVSVRRGYVAEVGRQSPGPKYARTQRSKKSGGTSERGPSRARESRERCA